MLIPNVLTIAGSDSSGGAGIQADIKSISAAGGYAMTAITALTAQNTQGVRGIAPTSCEFLRLQLDAIASDIRIDAIKIGMLGASDIVTTVAEWLTTVPDIPVVLDPVMIATSGARLLDADAMAAVRELLPAATVITPNLPELAEITGEAVCDTVDAAVEQARRYIDSLSSETAVVVKGGHAQGPTADNVLVTAGGTTFRAACSRVDTPHTHGTGCSLSSALATRMVLHSLPDAVRWSTDWLHGAIVHADQLEVGAGSGPIHHFYR